MHDRTADNRRLAFTIVELLVVIAIIAILVGIAVTVGSKVSAGSKARMTTESIRVLDTMLNEYQASQGSTPGATVDHPNTKGSTQTIIIADAVYSGATTTDKPLDTVAWFLVQMQESTTAANMIKSLPTKALQASYVDTGTRKPASYIDAMPDGYAFNTVLDAWGRPLRYVHPATDGVYDRDVYNSGQPMNSIMDRAAHKGRTYSPVNGKFARSKKNSDGGTCAGKRPYFYSCGPDGDPSTTDDNVYTTLPNFAPTSS